MQNRNRTFSLELRNWQIKSLIITAVCAGALFTYAALQDMGEVHGGKNWYDAISSSYPSFALLLYAVDSFKIYENGGQYAIQLGPHAILFGAAFWSLIDLIIVVLLSWVPVKFSSTKGEVSVFWGVMFILLTLPILAATIIWLLSLDESTRMFIELGVYHGGGMGLDLSGLSFLIAATLWGVFLTVVNFIIISSSILGGRRGNLMRSVSRS